MAPPLTPVSQLQQAEQVIRAGQLGQAAQLLQALLQQPLAQAHLSKAHELLGSVYLRSGDVPTATTHLEQATSLPNASAFAHYLLGSVRLSQGQYAEAARHLGRSVELGTPFFEALHNLGTARMQLGQRQAALEAFDKALSLRQHPEAWQSRGLVLQHLDRHADAVDSFMKVLALHPDHPQAWASLGSSYQVQGDVEQARKAYDRALTLTADPNEQARIHYSLASLQAQTAPEKAPQAYVQHLFDQCADQFDEILVGQLGYRGPERLFEAACQVRHDGGWRVLDLGCGTGLCGKVFQHKASVMDGVDLSPGMLDKARQLGIYRSLSHQDIQQHLTESKQTYDCMIAADVFVYVGKLDDVFAGMAAHLATGGMVCFSIETLPDPGADFELRTSGRYAQSLAYIDKLAASHGLETKVTFAQPVRMEKGLPVDGQFFVLQKTG